HEELCIRKAVTTSDFRVSPNVHGFSPLPVFLSVADGNHPDRSLPGAAGPALPTCDLSSYPSKAGRYHRLELLLNEDPLKLLHPVPAHGYPECPKSTRDNRKPTLPGQECW